MSKGGRGAKQGSEHHAAVLTEAAVFQIRLRAASGVSQGVLAVEFCVSPQTVNGIVRGRSWRHVSGPIGPFRPSLETVQVLVALAEKHGKSLEEELVLAVRELANREGIK